MALHAVKVWLNPSADPPIWKGNSAAALVKGCAVYRTVADGDITTLLVTAAKIIGFTAEACSAADATIKYYPGLPGIWFKLDFTGTYSAVLLGTYVDLTNTSGVPVANLAATSYNHVKLEEVIDNDSTNSVYTAWFSLGDTSNQTIIETA